MCRPQCVTVDRDRLPNVEARGLTGGPPGGSTAPRTEAGGQIGTPGGPTTPRLEADGQTATPDGPTVSRRRAAA
jgi:hypothetical protein